MSMSEQDKAREIAERIARRLGESTGDAAAKSSAATGNGELAALRHTLAEIQQKLAHLESHITHDETCATKHPNNSQNYTSREAARREDASSVQMAMRQPLMSGTYVSAVAHPSQERFGIGEAVSELVDYFENEKTCEMEPGGKPCDHCGVCSSRGF